MTRLAKYVLKILGQGWKRKSTEQEDRILIQSFRKPNFDSDYVQALSSLGNKGKFLPPEFFVLASKEDNLFFLSYPRKRSVDLG